jgi:predicted enzyme related to lactoylglutathione lyase
MKTLPVTSRISHTSIDSRSSYHQSVFWAAVLDWTEDPADPNLPEHDECLIMSRDGAQLLLFINVPEDKVVKNRIHLDLRPVDGTREEEVARLIQLGATEVADFRRPDGSGWITLTDPEGNEFCVLSPKPAGSGPAT